MPLGGRGLVERKGGGILTRHRPQKPSTTEGQIEEIAVSISGGDIASHVAEADPHTQYQKESEKDANNGYAGLDAGGLVPEPRISALIARVSQLVGVATTAVQGKTKVDNNSGGDPVALTAAGHGAAADPHGQYRLESASIGTGDLANDAVTYAKMQNVSATDKLLGRATAGAGDVEEIALTAAGRALIDDADAAAQRVTLGHSIGTFIPAITFGGAAVGVTYVTQLGNYVRFGDLIIATVRVHLSAKGSSVGQALITGLPFAITNAGAQNGTSGTIYCANMAGLTSPLIGLFGGGGTVVTLLDGGAGGSVGIDDTNFTNDSFVLFTVAYQAA